MRTSTHTLLTLACLACVSLPAQAQTLVEASNAAKAASAKGMGWPAAVIPTKVYTNETLKAAPAAVDAVTTAVAISPDVSPNPVAENRAAAVALLGARLDALGALVPVRAQVAAHYRDACAGKVTSAGWLLKGELITTPNAETPQCRTIMSDLSQQTSAIRVEYAAITEAARTHKVYPGVLRDLFAAHQIPNPE